MGLREKALSYLAEGHALLRAHGLYGASGQDHSFAMDRALEKFESYGGFGDAAEAAASIQAIYEAKRLVASARSSIEGRRIILGDWFMSLAVRLALPLRCPRLTELISEEFCRIGEDAAHASFRVSKKSFAATIDRFAEALCRAGLEGPGEGVEAAQGAARFQAPSPAPASATASASGTATASASSAAPACGAVIANATVSACMTTPASGATIAYRTMAATPVHRTEPKPAGDNKLLAALEAGYYKTAAEEARAALFCMESWFAAKYASDQASEMDGWIYGAIMSGGKRLRPILARLCAGVCAGPKIPHDIINIMSIIELMHSASLVHDDIVDRSPLRRSRATINAEKGDGYAAMCGFKMIADALELTTDAVNEKIPEIIADIPMRMCGGELSQFDIENKPELQSESEYYLRIGCKTAALIEGACVCGGVCGGGSGGVIDILAEYGRALGLLFQLRDDLLDYSYLSKPAGRRPTNPVGMDSEASGKPVSQDMERGVYSLPLLYARRVLAESDPEEYAKLTAIMRKHVKSPQDFCYLNETAEKTGGIAYARKRIEGLADTALLALGLLPQGPYTEALALIVAALADNCEAAPLLSPSEQPLHIAEQPFSPAEQLKAIR